MTKNKLHRAIAALILLLTMAPQTRASSVFGGFPAEELQAPTGQKLFSLEDLNFGGNNYRRLLPANRYLTWWGERLMEQDAECGWAVDVKPADRTATDKRHQVFALSDVGSDFHSAYGATYPYADQPLVLLANAKRRVLFDFKQKRIVWEQTAEDEQNSHWNACSRHVAYTRADHQLYVRTADNEERCLTTDGSRDIVYGEAVHRNEFGIEEGLFWSPDGQHLAFYRMDQTAVTDYPQVDITARIAELQPDKYPMAGMTSHTVTVGIYDVTTGKTVWLDTSHPSNQAVYFTNISWSPDSRMVFMQELNRAQNDCRLVAYEAATGRRVAELLAETSPKYVEPLHPLTFLPWDADRFIYQSQRDGYNHLYEVSLKARLAVDGRADTTTGIRPLTAGPFVVLRLVGFDTKQRAVIIESNESHPLQRNLYAVNTKTLRRILLDNGEGVHRGVLSASGSRLFDRYSAPEVPRRIDLYHSLTAKARRTTLLDAADPWQDYQQPRFECGTLKAADGQTDLYYRLVKPADFDPTKKYPTVVYVYGGPHAHNVEASWHWYSRSWETYMAQRGYVVFILDNRGSEHRGRDFEQATFHQLGQIEMQDQMQGVAFLRSQPWCDMDRLGVHGWSFGGYMTITLMLNHPDVFRVGVAGGPVIDWKWYEVMYGERYMGTPESNPDGYARTSLIAKAGQLKGRLEIIIGYNDPTVVPQHALSFIEACNLAGTQPDFYVYPGEGHNMMGHQSVHLHERITRYFDDHLK